MGEEISRIKRLFIDNKTAIIVTVILSICFNWVFLATGTMCPDAYSEGFDIYRNASWAGTLGRWVLRYWNGLAHNVVIVPFNYLVSIACIIVSSIMIIDLLNIKNRCFSFFTMLCVALAPAVSYQYLYGYMEMAFAFGLLFSVLAVWLFVNKKYLFGSLSLCLGLGSYQAYIGFAVTLILIVLVKRLNNNEEYKSIFPDFVRYLLYGILGCVLYIVFNKLNLMLYGLSMASYGGANQIGIGNSLSKLSDSIGMCYKSFDKFIRYPDTFRYSVILIFGLVICVLINRNSILNKILLLVLILLLPVAMNCVSIIAPDKNIAKQMMHQLVLFIPLLFCVIETMDIDLRLVRFGSVLTLVLCTILCFNYGIIDFCTQKSLENAQNRVLTLMETAIGNVITDEQYNKDSIILFLGLTDKDMLQEEDPVSQFSIYHDDVVSWNYKGAVIKLYHEFARDKLDFDIGLVNESEYDEIVNSTEFKEMPVYPSYGGLRRFDNIYVVKMEEEPPLQ